ncbi:MAG TPA: hypothetical protein VF595_04460 [Tepidisphaeraceae bacterium]|jgi:peptidoglycan hydrolase CwlO-like protein
MPRPTRVAIALFATAAAAIAQAPNPEQQDLLNQLRAAQDRKNELATENNKLRKQLTDLEKKVAEQSDQLSTLDNRAYYLREHYAAWEQFLDNNPAVRSMWLAFFSNAAAAERATDLLGDGRWPFAVEQ